MTKTEKLVESMLFNLDRTVEMLDTLSLAVEDATVGLGAKDPQTGGIVYSDENAKVVKRLDADDNYLLQARSAAREAEQWLKAMQDNSVVMLRFQRYVDGHIGKYPSE